VLRFPLFRGGARDRGDRIFQFAGRVTGAAYLAVVAVLLLGAALWALTLDESVWEKHLLHRVIGLGDGAAADVTFVPIALIDGVGEEAVLLGVGGVIIVEIHIEFGKIGLMFSRHPGDELLRFDSLLPGAQHDGGAVGVVRADVDTAVSVHILKTDPDIGLDVLHQVTDVDRAIGIGKGAGNQDVARFIVHYLRAGMGWKQRTIIT